MNKELKNLITLILENEVIIEKYQNEHKILLNMLKKKITENEEKLLTNSIKNDILLIEVIEECKRNFLQQQK